jgi:alpha-2-macroglobulin
MKRIAFVLVLAALCLRVPSADARQLRTSNPGLTVVSTAPEGEVASLAEAKEIRIVFSEPMVNLGRIPSVVNPPFVKISPTVPGAFRWSGTTVLIFTPDPKRPLSYATTYQVTIAAGTQAASGRKLARAVTFSFTTPTVRLLQTQWYRQGGTVDGRMLVVLRFNQPVRAADVAANLSAALEPHDFVPPVFTADEQARLTSIEPDGVRRFEAKVNATKAIAASTAPVSLRLVTDWDKKTYPPSNDLVVFESATPVLPESWVKLTLSERLRSAAGAATPGHTQSFTIHAEPAFFIDGFYCRSTCNPDDWNPIRMRAAVKVADLAAAISAKDMAGAAADVAKTSQPRQRGETFTLDATNHITLEDVGFGSLPPLTKYAVSVRSDLRASDGQVLGYPWVAIVDNWHRTAFTSFGDGHGVWEEDGGTTLPFYARNFLDIRQWIARVEPDQLMPTIRLLQEDGFHARPPGDGVNRRLPVTADRIQSHGLDLSKTLGSGGTGLVWTAIGEGQPIPQSRRAAGLDAAPQTRASIVQVTNLGITVKDSPQNTLVFVTRLDNGSPVEGATVSIISVDNKVLWRGRTGSGGVALAPQTPLRDPDNWWKFAFIVTAEKDGDVAYTGSDWNEGIGPWDFGTGLNLREAEPMLRGSVFTDRGVYRLGEEVHFKAILRQNTPTGVRLFPAGTPVILTIRDSQNRRVDERTVTLTEWSSADWTMTLPQDGALGYYSLRAVLESDRPKLKSPEERRRDILEPSEEQDEYVHYEKSVHGSFLVAAYKRPDFRVDVTLTGDTVIAGDPLKGVVTARYLFGPAMTARPVTWSFSKTPAYGAPRAITEKFPEDRWAFVGYDDGDQRRQAGEIRREEAKLGKAGDLPLRLDTLRDAGIPYVYTLEGDVEDVSRQHIANRGNVTVHPAPWYIGVRRPAYFVDQKNGLKTEIVAVATDGSAVAGVPVQVKLTQIQWQMARRAEGNGFYTWDTERKEVAAGQWDVTTANDPAPLTISFANGGYFVLEAKGTAADGRFAVTRTSFYVLGSGYTAWERFDHNRIELVPERKTYKPGETARIMIQSPWERATALVTTEREGIRTYRPFLLTSTQESISIPIKEDDIPNVFVSVLLIKGRSNAAPSTSAVEAFAAGTNLQEDPSDPGKPAFRLGYVELKVEDRTKRLTVTVSANQQEYRPAKTASVALSVSDHQHRGTSSEVTLWAVDYGVLSLTSYQTPDVLGSVYVHKALQVFNSDNRQRIISRRVLTPKGATDGGGGGADNGAGTLRKDFRVLAFWLGSVATDTNGRARVDVTLPESLTTYRIMAVAADRNSRFGSGDSEVRINKPLTLKPTFPRFMAVGDRAHFGAVITSQLAAAATATVTIKSLDPGVLDIAEGSAQSLLLAPGGSIEARFDASAKSIGRARVLMTVKAGDETDAFEDTIPVEVLASPETVAAYGEATDVKNMTTEGLTIPAGVVTGFGGLHVEMSSTAMVGLGEGARYLVEYPYGCAEQKGSRALALLLAADLGDAFTLAGVTPSKMRPAVQQTLKELERFQCSNGGFAYWPGACYTVSPYLTAYLLHVFQVATDLKYPVDAGMRDRAYRYLEQELAQQPPSNEGWWPSYTAWQAFAVKVLVEGGRTQDSNINRLYGYRDRMPVFALAYLHDALMAKKEISGPRIDDLRRRMSNAVLPEGGSAHVEELADPYLLWFWNSNVRSTSIVLNTLVRANAPATSITPLVRWLMAARKGGRWGNTQDNAHAMESLVTYYRKYETTIPNFSAVVTLGADELARESFKARSTESKSLELPMTQLLSKGAVGSSQPLTFTREGAGTLFYTTRLRYAADALYQQGLDSGFGIDRRYEPYVENGSRPVSTTYKAGDLVRVTLTFRLTKERRFVAVTDPVPAGFEAVESWFATTARAVGSRQDRQTSPAGEPSDIEESWDWMWRYGGFDHVERHDDRVQLFATRLSEGTHEFSYIVRATTAGTFRTAPARVEEMYEPEVFGRTGTAIIEVKK